MIQYLKSKPVEVPGEIANRGRDTVKKIVAGIVANGAIQRAFAQ